MKKVVFTNPVIMKEVRVMEIPPSMEEVIQAVIMNLIPDEEVVQGKTLSTEVMEIGDIIVTRLRDGVVTVTGGIKQQTKFLPGLAMKTLTGGVKWISGMVNTMEKALKVTGVRMKKLKMM